MIRALSKVNYELLLDTPVNLIKIAEQVGVKEVNIVPFDGSLYDVAGFLDFKKEVIYINKNESRRNQRFSLAHEIGHYLLHNDGRETVHYDFRDSKLSAREYEADYFAKELLMPREVLRMLLCRYGITEKVTDVFLLMDIINETSTIFDTPTSVMTGRLKELNIIR